MEELREPQAHTFCSGVGVKIHGLEKWRFLICTLCSASGQATCSRIERQSATGSLPGRETASRKVRSSSLQQENYKGWIEMRESLFSCFAIVKTLKIFSKQMK